MAEAEKKVHWTQRPGGKKKLAAALKKGHKTRNSKGGKPNGSSSGSEVPIKETPVFAYALGHIECWIETYAKGADVPPEALAAELGKILQIKTRR